MASSTPWPIIYESDWVDQFDVVDKDAFIGFYALGLALTILFNTAVIVVIMVLVVKAPHLREPHLPKFFAVTVCCQAQIIIAAWLDALDVHDLLSNDDTSAFPCSVRLSMFFAWDILSAFTTLTVAVAIFTEVMRLIGLKTAVRAVCTVCLLAFAAVYALAVSVPINYVKILYDPEQPCHEDGYVVVNEFGYWNRVIRIVTYAPPAVAVLLSLIVLVLTSVITWQPAADRGVSPNQSLHSIATAPVCEATPAGHMQVGYTSGPHGQHGVDSGVQTVTNIYENIALQAATAPVWESMPPSQTQGSNASPGAAPRMNHINENVQISVPITAAAAGMQEKRPFAIDLLLAGIITIILPFPGFYLNVFWYNSDRVEVPEQRIEFWKFVSGVQFLYLSWLVILPCCWLMGKDIRAAVWRFVTQLLRASRTPSNF